jgi:hypothetical protein
MDLLSPIGSLGVFGSIALPATLALVLTWLLVRLRQRGGSRSDIRDAIDTVAGWQPEASRVLTIDERHAYDLLKRAVPGFLILAQVPLSRFLRVPMRHSYSDWLQRVGSLNADLVLCDPGSRVLAVIDIRQTEESSRSRRRHERMARVLRAANVYVYTWREGDLPSVQQVRAALGPLLGPAGAAIKAPVSKPMPLIPVAEMEEILADGDRLAAEAEALEPVNSGFFDDFEPTAQQQ